MAKKGLTDTETDTLNSILEDLGTLIGFDSLSPEQVYEIIPHLKSGDVKTYMSNLLNGSTPEYTLRDSILYSSSVFRKYFFGIASPEKNVGDYFVDYEISGNFPDRNIYVEIKSLFYTEYESKKGGDRRAKRLVRNNIKIDNHKEQIVNYAKEGGEYIVLTNLKEWYFFRDNVTIASFKPFDKKELSEVASEFEAIGSLWDYIERIEDQSHKGELDKDFFLSLQSWVRELSQAKFRLNEREKTDLIVSLINRLVFIQTLDDYGVIEFRWLRKNFKRLEKEWKSAGISYIMQLFFEELMRFFNFHYDTELFIGDTIESLDQEEANVELFYRKLKLVIGLNEWQSDTFGYTGIVQYNYRLINEDVLGKAYETFLAEIRHDTGVYYTPRYISLQIVSQNLSKIIENYISGIQKACQDLKIGVLESLVKKFTEIKVLDPACGSGSFLIKAFQEFLSGYQKIWKLLEHFERGFIANNESLESVISNEGNIIKIRDIKKTLNPGQTHQNLISTVLLRHIHGIDIDHRALSIAKVNLWLSSIKAAPNLYRFDSLPKGLRGALPRLDKNIVMGNTIVNLPNLDIVKSISERYHEEVKKLHILSKRYEFYRKKEDLDNLLAIKKNIKVELDRILEDVIASSGSPALDGVNSAIYPPLDFWEAYFNEDGTTKPFDASGFDFVFGNPPYTDSEHMDSNLRNYAKKIRGYFTADGNWDLFCIFIEQGISLTRNGGRLSYIVPNRVLGVPYAKKTRELLSANSIDFLYDYSRVNVFEEASTYPITFAITKNSPAPDHTIDIAVYEEDNSYLPNKKYETVLQQSELGSKGTVTWDAALSPHSAIIQKIYSASTILETISSDISDGSTVGEAYQLEKLVVEHSDSIEEVSFRLVNTGTIDRYVSMWGVRPTRFVNHLFSKPVVTESDLRSVSEGRLAQTKSKKIIVAGMSLRLEAIFDFGTSIAGKSTVVIQQEHVDLRTVLPIINSNITSFIFKELFRSLSLGGGYIGTKPYQVRTLPIPKSILETQSESDNLIGIGEEISERTLGYISYIQIWKEISEKLRNEGDETETVGKIMANDLAMLRKGRSDSTTLADSTHYPGNDDEQAKTEYSKLYIKPNEEMLSLFVYGRNIGGHETTLAKLKFRNVDTLIHWTCAIQSVIVSKMKIKSLQHIYDKVEIPMIKPNGRESAGIIIRAVNEAFASRYDNSYKSLTTFEFLKNMVDLERLMSYVEEFLFKSWGLKDKEKEEVVAYIKSECIDLI